MKFGEKLAKLDSILAKLEGEKIPLEESLTLFEAGVALLKDCRATLKQVEQRVAMLMNESEED